MKIRDGKLFRQQCYINGQWVDAASGERLGVSNPADGQAIGTVPKMGAEIGSEVNLRFLGTRILLIATLLRRMLVHIKGASAVSYFTYGAVDATQESLPPNRLSIATFRFRSR